LASGKGARTSPIARRSPASCATRRSTVSARSPCCCSTPLSGG
jgi:hypothetical protein